jgi:hypothetical protein
MYALGIKPLIFLKAAKKVDFELNPTWSPTASMVKFVCSDSIFEAALTRYHHQQSPVFQEINSVLFCAWVSAWHNNNKEQGMKYKIAERSTERL